MYIAPTRSTEKEKIRARKTEIETRYWPCQRGDILLGAFNAHSDVWDKAVTEKPSLRDRRGDMIEDWLMDTDMTCLNDGRPTRNARQEGHMDTAPDLSIVQSSLMEKFSWDTLDDTGSDHKPILITYREGFEIPKVNNTTRYKWKLAKGDWEKFKQQVDREIPTSYEDMNVNELEKVLRKTILRSAKKNVGKKKVNNRTRMDLGEEVKQEAAKRNQLRKEINDKDKRAEWVESSRKVAELTKEERSKKWIEYVEGIDPKTSCSEVWRTIRNLEGKGNQGGKNDTLVVGDKAYVSDRDKANQFAKTYKGFSLLETRKSDRVIRKEVRKYIKKDITAIEESEQDITMLELERAIDDAKKGKAAGEDDIPHEMIKQLGPRTKQFLLFLYNKIWRGEELPTMWRKATVKPLLKEWKDPKDTVSYRPIALTSCLGKILERIIADRLMYVLESRNVINKNQAGFRQNRATTDQVLKLVQSASDQLHSREKSKLTICTFFDYEKAYDKVWRDGLLYKMAGLGIPKRFMRYTRHFLSGRVTSVMVNEVRSKNIRLNEGLPQGSCISPLLFLIFINDIDTDLHPDTLVSLFADDTAIWCQAEGEDDHNKVKERMQQEMEKILQWANKWKMKINEGKTKTLLISTKASEYSWDPEFTLNGKKVAAIKEYKFLGILVDNKLLFSEHVSETVRKCRKRVNIIRYLGTKNWGQSLESMRTTYITYIRSCLEYGSSSWWPWISDTQKIRLERVQRAGLRAVAGLAQGCPSDYLNLETGIEPLSNRMEKLDAILKAKYEMLPDEDPRKEMIDRKAPIRLKTRQGWRNSTQDGEHNRSINRFDQQPSPWTQFSNIEVDKVELQKKKTEYTNEQLKALATAKIASYVVNYTIYTDGSTDGQQTNGGAGTYVEDAQGREVARYEDAAGKLCSSYGGECVAMYRACNWIREKEDSIGEKLEVLIATDSESLVNSISSRCWKIKDEWLKKIKQLLSKIKSNVKILWVPSHCDIDGNEVADQLANEGRKKNQSDVPVTQAIIKAKIKARKWMPTHTRAKKMYGKRLNPKFDVEKTWTRKIRSLFARLRTDHAKELANYRHRIGTAESPDCVECQVPETIEHLLCHCPSLEEARARVWPHGKVTINMMVENPEVCRQILQKRIPNLRTPLKKHM